jgi:hypothetical protein
MMSKPQNDGGYLLPDWQKSMTLLYLRSSKQFNLNDYTMDVWQPEDYNLMRQLPVAEMLTDNPVDMAEELIELSMTAEWQGAQRRPIKRGDIFCWGYTPFVFIPTAETKAFEEFGVTVFPLKSWPKYGIAQLSEDILKDKLP